MDSLNSLHGPGNSKLAPALALFGARIVYAFNWYNVGAVLALIGASLNANAAQLGLVLGAFLAGVGIFQIPAGIVDLRWGARRTALTGLLVMGLAGIASAFSTRILDLVLLRFLAGVGAAFFFSPALSLVASYFPPGQRGPVIGLYNGGFSLGGAVGVTAGAAVGLRFGWQFALGLGGIALLALVAFNWHVLPRESVRRSAAEPDTVQAAVRRILLSRSIWALALGLTGFWASMYIVAQDFVLFAHNAWGTQTAANLTTVFVVMSFPGGPLGGWIAERGWDRRTVLAFFAVACGALVATIPYLGLYPTAIVFVVMGLFDGIVFAVLYLIPSYLAESQGHGLALGIAFVNSVQVLLGSAVAVGFGFVAVAAGFTVAWLLVGGLAVAMIPLVLLVAPNRAGVPLRPSTGETTTWSAPITPR
ncbi:MAG: MFS transporter [Thermoplasmata archaeon]|nr:MFS transporter [Thermoplasmata archaeon]